MLPADVTTFVGRKPQLTDARRLLSQSRVLTLTGAGGVGKTRLAVHLADGMRRTFRDGVRYIELAELEDPSLLAYTAANRLGLSDQASRAAIDAIIEHLQARELLLVLDNCEHLVDDCAVFVGTLVRSCPGLRTLATSRQSLGVYGETILHVPPLPMPDPDHGYAPEDLARYDAVRLFVDRATAALPGFRLDSSNSRVIARLCHGLDGIPLAIELAAAWLRVLSLEQIEERLTERFHLLTGGPTSAPERQQTLRALMDWSYGLCSPSDQIVWARASVFSGGFDLAAITYVADDAVPPEDMPYVIRSLIDKSIVIREQHESDIRYRMLETVRQYGRERLDAAGEHRAVGIRHRDWYAGLTERFEVGMLGPEQVSWFHRMRREHSNVRVALNFCNTQPGEAVTGMRMASHLDNYWSFAFHSEARHWFEQALAATSDITPERVTVLRLNSWYALLQGDYEAGIGPMFDAADLAEKLGLAIENAYFKLNQAMMALFCGDLETAALIGDDCLSRFRNEEDIRGEIFSLYQLGLAVGAGGESVRGLAILDECHALCARIGDVFWRAFALWGICLVTALDGDLPRAEATGREALSLFRKVGNKFGMCLVVEVLALVAEKQGRHVRAAVIFGAASSLWRDIGSSVDFSVALTNLNHWYGGLTRSALGDQRFDAAFAKGSAFSTGKAIDYANGAGTPARPGREEADACTPLTPRQREIAKLVADGLSNKEIAARLCISPRTAEAHVQNMLINLGFTRRAQVAAWIAARTSAASGVDG
ncbi:ATP-binding protein [Streptomyces sp. M41]|uniref:ATP-binding protein n=1 Tax=Streptomyces sp. M41 TaxID=3059412 RepID=UPI00374CC834